MIIKHLENRYKAISNLIRDLQASLSTTDAAHMLEALEKANRLIGKGEYFSDIGTYIKQAISRNK